MSAPKPSPCSSCQVPIYWARWRESGSWCPVNAQPEPGEPPPRGKGNIVLTLSGGELLIDTWKPEHGFARNRYVSHFVTCPNAAEHRRRK